MTTPPRFVRALDLLDRPGPSLSTGVTGLDDLVGGLRGGSSYLFYDAGGFLHGLVPPLMVKATRQGKVAYMNNTDYYSEKTLVQPDRLAFYAKREGLEPESVLSRIYFVAAYNELRQGRAVEALARMVRQEEDTRLVVIHNLARFIPGAKDRKKAIESLNRSLAPLWQLAAERSIVVVITVHASRVERWSVPRPSGSHMLWHLANVMVFFREPNAGGSIQATLVKHPTKPTPQSVELFQGGEPLMGRVTPSFTQVYQELIERLRRDFVPMMRDARHREAFEALLTQAWDRERAAMGNSEVALLLDALNLMANVHNKSQLAQLKGRVEEIEGRLARLETR